MTPKKHTAKFCKLLSVCRDGGILSSRNAVLERAGYTVITATGLNDALAALQRKDFDLVIIGHLYTTEEKNLIASKAKSRGLPILCMFSEAVPPRVQARDFIHNLDGPDKLLSAVAALLSETRGNPREPQTDPPSPGTS